MKGSDPFWGTPAFNNQTSLVRCVDKEKKRDIESNFLQSVFEKTVPMPDNIRCLWMVESVEGP